MATIVDLVNLVDGSEIDIRRVKAVVAQLVADGDKSLLPELQMQLDALLEQKNFHGRDMVCEVMCGLAGVDALEPLLRAAARDIGDDQDSLQAMIVDLIVLHREEARAIAERFTVEPETRLRDVGTWVLGYVEQYGVGLGP